jgi:hypothetical protein
VGINCGQSQTLAPQFQPANATNKTVTWASSDPALAEVSPAGSVRMNALGEATITVTTQEGGHSASCKVSTYLGSAEKARQAEFDRLSGPVTANEKIILVKEMADFEVPYGYGFSFDMDRMIANGFNYAVSSVVTNQQLKEQLEKEVERRNLRNSYVWAHEFQHGVTARYVFSIKKSKF